ncbi:MAG TPA: GTPase, partial [Nitrospiria bacterium]|nr:GTPase [Nitrospiria bacterium]
DKLFATLDPTVRKLKLSSKREILVSDTVGFIQRLPHQLIAAFKATLEEVLEADLLLHIIDMSHPHAENQRASVQKVLEELGADKKPQLEVYNKIDLSAVYAARPKGAEIQPSGVFISALRGDGIQDLLERMETMLFPSKERWQLVIPAERGDLLARLYQSGKVTGRKNQGSGVRLEAEVPAQLADTFLLFRVMEAGQRPVLAKRVSAARAR